eukprot:UN23143
MTVKMYFVCMCLLCCLYVWELCYRIAVSWDLALHHICTMSLIILLYLSAIDRISFQFNFRLGGILALHALTEQPVYLAVLVRSFNRDKSKYFFIFAGIWVFGFHVFICLFYESLDKSS